MATISKFYLHTALTPNTGQMPNGNPFTGGAVLTNNAFQSDQVRDATDVIGTANPDTETQVVSDADQTAHCWALARFVSRPLATQTLPSGNWTLSYARSESNLNHNQTIRGVVYTWRPSTGAVVLTPTDATVFTGTEPTVAGAEQAESLTATMVNVSGGAVLDGDVLGFDVSSVFTQSMSTSYTDAFCYDGTTEASITTCASFLTPPAALTLFTPRAKQSSVVGQAVKRSSVWMKSHSGIVVPRLWTPADSLEV